MSRVRRTVEFWHCDMCGHEWTVEKYPSRCANQKCRSRMWDKSASNRTDHVMTTPAPVSAMEILRRLRRPTKVALRREQYFDEETGEMKDV
jgi:IS5 family transposase